MVLHSLFSCTLKTDAEGLYELTAAVKDAITQSGVEHGICVVYCPHTTAGITLNEHADPDVRTDLLYGLAQAFPHRVAYRHAEGNSAAHLKASCIGASVTLIVENASPLLGTWQGIFFCEFDGPRDRHYHIKVLGT